MFTERHQNKICIRQTKTRLPALILSTYYTDALFTKVMKITPKENKYTTTRFYIYPEAT